VQVLVKLVHDACVPVAGVVVYYSAVDFLHFGVKFEHLRGLVGVVEDLLELRLLFDHRLLLGELELELGLQLAPGLVEPQRRADPA